jgi:YD repeat-containing protein
VVTVLGYVARDLPPADHVITNPQFPTAVMYDRQGRLLSEMVDPRDGKRRLVPRWTISPSLVDAAIRRAPRFDTTPSPSLYF